MGSNRVVQNTKKVKEMQTNGVLYDRLLVTKCLNIQKWFLSLVGLYWKWAGGTASIFKKLLKTFRKLEKQFLKVMLKTGDLEEKYPETWLKTFAQFCIKPIPSTEYLYNT